jgi:hypothetical protein
MNAALRDFKGYNYRLGCTEFLSALARGTAANFEAEFAGFEGQFTIIIEEGHHLRSDCEIQPLAFTCFEMNSLEADQVMKGHNRRGVEVSPVELGSFG